MNSAQVVLRLRSGAGYTVTTQHVADRLIGDLMSQIGERPDDPIIAP